MAIDFDFFDDDMDDFFSDLPQQSEEEALQQSIMRDNIERMIDLHPTVLAAQEFIFIYQILQETFQIEMYDEREDLSITLPKLYENVRTLVSQLHEGQHFEYYFDMYLQNALICKKLERCMLFMEDTPFLLENYVPCIQESYATFQLEMRTLNQQFIHAYLSEREDNWGILSEQ